MIEANEPPINGLIRELKEELHLELAPSQLALSCIDWVSPHGPWDDSLMLSTASSDYLASFTVRCLPSTFADIPACRSIAALSNPSRYPHSKLFLPDFILPSQIP